MASPIHSRRCFAMASSVKEAHDLMDEATRKISEASSTASAEEAVELKRHSLELYDSIKVLHLIVSIRDALRETKDDWIPKGQIEQIIRASHNSQYREDDIETIFYQNGGATSLLVLYCVTRNHKSIFAQINALSVEARAELAELCGREKINDFIAPWINKLDYTRGTLHYLEEEFFTKE